MVVQNTRRGRRPVNKGQNTEDGQKKEYGENARTGGGSKFVVLESKETEEGTSIKETMGRKPLQNITNQKENTQTNGTEGQKVKSNSGDQTEKILGSSSKINALNKKEKIPMSGQQDKDKLASVSKGEGKVAGPKRGNGRSRIEPNNKSEAQDHVGQVKKSAGKIMEKQGENTHEDVIENDVGNQGNQPSILGPSQNNEERNKKGEQKRNKTGQNQENEDKSVSPENELKTGSEDRYEEMEEENAEDLPIQESVEMEDAEPPDPQLSRWMGLSEVEKFLDETEEELTGERLERRRSMAISRRTQ